MKATFCQRGPKFAGDQHVCDMSQKRKRQIT